MVEDAASKGTHRWAVTVGGNMRGFLETDAASVRAVLERLRPDERPFRPIAELIGAEAAEELATDFVRAVLKRAAIPGRRFPDLRTITSLDYVPEEEGLELRIRCYGHTTFEEWDGSVVDARTLLDEKVRDIAGDIKGDRGRLGGQHPWDD